MRQILVLIYIFLLCTFSFGGEDYSELPDVINCKFKAEAVVDYSIIYKKYEAKSGTKASFSFKIAGLSRGKPVIVGENASNELQIVKKAGNVVYLVENLGLGYNVIAIFLESKKVTLTKQYDIGNGSPFVYSWVGEAIY